MRILQKRLVGFSLALGLLLSVALSVVYPETDDYLLENTGPTGCSRLSNLVGATIEKDLKGIKDLQPKQALVLIVSPLKPFTREEIESLKQFVGGGGTVLLADNFGEGNSLLEQLGVPARFNGSSLEDPLIYAKQSQFPVAYDLARSPLTTGVDELLLGNPTAITVSEKKDIKPLARTSPYSFLDKNRNRRKDTDEERGPFIVLASLGIGQGVLILLSSPGMLTNAQLNEKHNSRLILNIIGLPRGPEKSFTVLFDETHLEKSWGTSLRQALREILFTDGTETRTETKLSLALVAACLIILFAILQDEHPAPSQSAVLSEKAEELSRKHPHWNRKTLEYLDRHIARTAGRGFHEKPKE